MPVILPEPARAIRFFDLKLSLILTLVLPMVLSVAVGSPPPARAVQTVSNPVPFPAALEKQVREWAQQHGYCPPQKENVTGGGTVLSWPNGLWTGLDCTWTILGYAAGEVVVVLDPGDLPRAELASNLRESRGATVLTTLTDLQDYQRLQEEARLRYSTWVILGMILGFLMWGLVRLELPLYWRMWRLWRLAVSAKSWSQGEVEPEEARAGLSVEISGVAWLKEPFRQFQKAWRNAFLEGKHAALGEVWLMDYLRTDEILPGNRRLALALPGIFVALGILGTFIGLVQGLPAARSAGLGVGAGELQARVGRIIGSLSVAFWTSIGGISTSVFFLWVDRATVHGVSSRVLRLSRAVERCFPFLSPQAVARLEHQLLTDSRDSIQTLATDLSTELANAIVPALDQAMVTHLAPAVGRMEEAVSRLVRATTEEQVEGLQKLVTNFVNAIDQELGGQFGQLRQVLDQTVEAQGAIGEGLEGFSLRLSQVFDVQERLIGETSRAAETLGNSLDRLEQIASNLGDAATRITGAGSALKDSVGTLVQAQKVALAQSQAMMDAQKGLSESWTSAVHQAEGAIHRIDEAARRLGEGLDEQLGNALGAVDRALAEATSHFSGTLAQLSGSIEELPSAVQSIQESCAALKEQGQSMVAVLGQTQELVRGVVAENVNEAVQAAERLQQVVREAQEVVRISGEAGARLAVASERLAGTGEKLQELQSSTAGDMQAWFKDLREGLRSISARLDGGGRLSEIGGSLQSIESRLANLHRTIEKLGEHMSSGGWLKGLWGRRR